LPTYLITAVFSRESHRLRVTFPGQGVYYGPARIREPEELGHLVVGLPDRVVQRLSQDPQVVRGARLGKERVAPRHDQHQERMGRQRSFEQGSVRVCLEVVDGDQRNVPRPRHRLGGRHPDYERAGEPGPGGNGYEPGALVRGRERLGDDDADGFDVGTGRYLGDHTAVGLVEVYLGSDDVRKRSKFFVQERGRRLVAGSLDAED
jgi:hypothetical protein